MSYVSGEMAAVASASTTQFTSRLSDEQDLKEFCDIVWGPNIRLDVFQRWSQGLLSLVYSQTLNVHAQNSMSNGANSDQLAITYPQNIDFNSMTFVTMNLSFFDFFDIKKSSFTQSRYFFSIFQ